MEPSWISSEKFWRYERIMIDVYIGNPTEPTRRLIMITRYLVRRYIMKEREEVGSTEDKIK
jgi:hypothetical protein